jgi:chromosomal replication initiation ATPase DnaA
VRQYSDTNIEQFKTELRNVDWDNICSSENANVSYTNFINVFNNLHDKCIPLKIKKITSKKNTPKSPWITPSLIKSIRRKI